MTVQELMDYLSKIEDKQTLVLYTDADNYAFEIREVVNRTDQFAMDDEILKKPGVILF